MDYIFKLDFEVRDYECDIQGIVNNSVYMNYLEHTRHKFLESVGVNFTYFAKNKINLVVSKAEIDYKISLKSLDKFVVCLNFQKNSQIRFVFLEDIYNEKNELVLKSKITGTIVDICGKIIRNNNLFDGI